MAKPKIDVKVQFKHRFHHQELTKLTVSLEKRPVVYEKAGDGLMLVGIQFARLSSLSKRLLGKSRRDFKKLLAALPQHGRVLMDLDQIGKWNPNRLLISSLNLEGMIGTIPIFWWPIPIEFLRKLFFFEVTVKTLYNPAYLIKRLKQVGFDVELLPTPPHFKVTKVIRNSRLEMAGIDYFLGVIQTSLISEDSVVAMFSEMLKRAEADKFPLHSKVQLNIQHFF